MAGESRTVPAREPRILADRMRRAVWPLGPWKAAALIALALSGVAAFGLVPGPRLDEVPTQLTVRVLDRPPIADAQAGRADFAYWREERVRRGDTIGELLARAGIDDAALRAVVRSDPVARPLYQLKPGQAVRVATDRDGSLLELRFVWRAVGETDKAEPKDCYLAAQAYKRRPELLELRGLEPRSSDGLRIQNAFQIDVLQLEPGSEPKPGQAPYPEPKPGQAPTGR